MVTLPKARERWFPPRTDITPVGRRWNDWWRWLRHQAGQLERELHADVAATRRHHAVVAELSEGDLSEEIDRVRQALRISRGQESAAARLANAEALAVASEVAIRTLDMSPYPVQLLAALGMARGCGIQMAAGEGKTLCVGLAAVLHGWCGRVCHVVTSNDYLAARDVDLMQPLFMRCGLTVAAALPDAQPDEQAAVYAGDVVYATGKQLLADFLRDQILLGGASDGMRRMLWQLKGNDSRKPVMRGLYAAIIDEADSVLIDEANTPLIISSPQPNAKLADAVRTACEIVDQLEPEVDYRLEQHFREVEFSEGGDRRIEAMVERLPPVWHAPDRRDDLLTQAILARDFFQRDRHYIVDDGKVVIVDENTGRAMPGRSWSYGLHQAIEAREGIEITPPSRTMARMSFQHFFQRYHRLCGASGTLQGIRFELWKTYGLLTITVPTRVPSRLDVLPTRCFEDRDEKWEALIDTVQHLHRRRLPVLLGSRRISDSELLKESLELRGMTCSVLNAKEHAAEAEVIAMAGEAGRITVATNMAGRGTDIKVSAAVLEQGGLQVLMLEPHESARVDWQLFGRAGRHGSPGRAEAFAALDDDLLRRHLPVFLRPLLWLAAAGVLRQPLARVLLKVAQWRAQSRAWWGRRQLQQREVLLKEQLSFTGGDDLAAEALAAGPKRSSAGPRRATR